ncbi:MAG: hypothetical protein KJZ80_14280 [Hyphomicrobiaceae bacterium]|nr:hypothetical protein [Hyphomicrobiaceae bacterium]
MADRNELIRAVDMALAGDREAAHTIVQGHEDDSDACWIHAVLHKMEGDASNSRYWYGRTVHAYEAYTDPRQELQAIKAALTY